MAGPRNADLWDLQGITFRKTLSFMDSTFEEDHEPSSYSFFDRYTSAADPLIRLAGMVTGIIFSLGFAGFAFGMSCSNFYTALKTDDNSQANKKFKECAMNLLYVAASLLAAVLTPFGSALDLISGAVRTGIEECGLIAPSV